ncbi:uncharacterized protein LOC108023259 isoform X2 [Drosophila biarmipes]|uniref:uncharacterized protein LOC108023259 isoform X2 n=1 Tax=Drosophila biarmipes TaxID=125945 RepID=UPI001CDAB99E|nr:uncharacterized protein LOC108023259 isoform X2 [Drosophila biarmipes]
MSQNKRTGKVAENEDPAEPAVPGPQRKRAAVRPRRKMNSSQRRGILCNPEVHEEEGGEGSVEIPREAPVKRGRRKATPKAAGSHPLDEQFRELFGWNFERVQTMLSKAGLKMGPKARGKPRPKSQGKAVPRAVPRAGAKRTPRGSAKRAAQAAAEDEPKPKRATRATII